STHTAPPAIYPPSLHDALPISAAPAPKAEAKPAAAPAAAEAPKAAATKAADSGPAVARLAAESGIDAASVPASGKDGRVTKGDKIGRAHAELQSRENLVCRLLL